MQSTKSLKLGILALLLVALIIFSGCVGTTPPIYPSSARIVYRALCVGVGDYEIYDPPPDGDLLGPPYSVDRMIKVFNQCKFGSDEVVFSTPVSLKDLNATKTAIISGIASAFSGADDNDISYFYFTGHGDHDEGSSTSYICPTDFNGSVGSAITVDELEIALSTIPGIKVVILGTCSSGGFIGKNKGKITNSKEEAISFNDEIINVFSQAQSKGMLTTNQYKVLTSCHYYQTCTGLEDLIDPENSFELFTKVLCDGCGYDGNYYADIANDNNTRVTLDEAYEYVKEGVPIYVLLWNTDIRQDVQVFPEDSNFTIVEY